MLALFFGLTFAAMNCPGSGSWFGHAGMRITTLAASSCANVQAEMKARINGQCNPPATTCGWWDPHNLGYYHDMEVDGNGIISIQHLSGNKKYTDKIMFTLTDRSGSCLIEGCSESQVTSYMDFSTNYCNLEMLFCGKADGCKPVTYDFTNTLKEKKPMAGATAEMSDCLKVMGGDSELVKAVKNGLN